MANELAVRLTALPIKTQWARCDPTQFLGKDTDKALALIKESVAIAKTVVDTTATVLDAVASVLLIELDILKAAFTAARQVIEALIRVYTETSVGATWYLPTSFRSAPTASQAAGLLADSFFDLNDPNRPIASTPDTPFALLVWFVAAPNVFKLIEAWTALAELFGMPLPPLQPGNVQSMYAQYGGWPLPPPKGKSLEPDWILRRLSDIEPFSEFVSVLLDVRDKIAQEESRVDLLKQEIELIRRRMQQIEERIQQVLNLIQRLAEAAVLFTGIELLVLTGFGDSDAQAAAIRSAVSAPESPFAGSTGDEMVAFLAWHFQGGGGGIEVLLTILGVQERVEAATEEIMAAESAVREDAGSVVSSGKAIRQAWRTS